jgi:hypothetical protein
MLDSGGQHEQISDAERILLTQRLEDDLTFENVDAHRPIGVVGWEITVRRQGHDRKTKRPFLDERSRASPVTRHQGLIDRLLVSRKMAN